MAHKRVLLLLVAALGIAAASVAVAQATTGARSHRRGGGHGSHTATPIKHVVVIFQENESFDHYFAPAKAPPQRQSADEQSQRQPAQRLDSSPTGLAGNAGGQLTCDEDHN